MKHFIDGDQLVITKDNFVNLQESPAVFFPLASKIAQTVQNGGVRALPVGDLAYICLTLTTLGKRSPRAWEMRI